MTDTTEFLTVTVVRPRRAAEWRVRVEVRVDVGPPVSLETTAATAGAGWKLVRGFLDEHFSLSTRTREV